MPPDALGVGFKSGGLDDPGAIAWLEIPAETHVLE